MSHIIVNFKSCSFMEQNTSTFVQNMEPQICQFFTK